MIRNLFYLCMLLLISLPGFTVTGCTTDPPADIHWATPTVAATSGIEEEIQKTLDTYAASLVAKDEAGFMGTIDPDSAAYAAQQQELYRRLEDVPFDDYRITVESISESTDGTAVAKVLTASTLSGSFSGLPQPVRSAYTLNRREDGWKLAGDASEQALGRKRDARLEDFGKVMVHQSEHAIVLYLQPDAATAEHLGSQVDTAYPRLVEALPGAELPLVPVLVFSNQEQLDQAYPGQWQEWVGGASLQLGDSEREGGEIIVQAQVYTDTGSYAPQFQSQTIAHELTHIALFPRSGPKTPPFLVEGLADYVAGVEASPLLAERLRSGGQLSPSLSDLYQPSGFNVLLSNEAAQLAYDEAGTAVAYIESAYGNDAVMELLREFKSREFDDVEQDQLVDEVFQQVLGTSWDDFENGWHNYVLGG